MRNLAIVLLAAFASTPAFALHGMNCWSATGWVSFTEKEIWGVNPMSCGFFGQTVREGVLTLKRDSVTMIANTAGRSTRDWKKTYVVNAKLTSGAGNLPRIDGRPEVAAFNATLICEEWSSSAMDLVAPSTHCDIKWQ